MPSILTLVRDIAIIVLALESLIIGFLLIVLAIQIRGLARMLEEEVKPILDSANETVSTVRGTTSFVSDTLITPLVGAASFATALGKVIRVLRRRPKRE
jgi:hypothetical protein